jgi:zinc-ribbon domain/Phospholipase_D-nuclease N-terminal
MSVRQFLDVVPKSAKAVACGVAGGVILIGFVGTFIEGHGQNTPFAVLVPGAGFGLLAGVVIAIWILCLGYVHADARRRGMPPILWTLIAAFIPNLLGFLLYFALRRPIALPCPQCGQPTTAEQRFCSWCGYQGSSALSTQAS